MTERKETNGKTPSSGASTGQLMAWPWTELTSTFDSMFSDLDRSLDRLFTPLLPQTASRHDLEAASTRSFLVDTLDRGDHYLVTVELPGFTRDMVQLQVTRKGLVLRARRKAATEDKGRDYVQREKSHAAFEHHISFPVEVSPDKVQESMKNGVLEIRIPKREPKLENKAAMVGQN
jgi:HSP20 family protein